MYDTFDKLMKFFDNGKEPFLGTVELEKPDLYKNPENP